MFKNNKGERLRLSNRPRTTLANAQTSIWRSAPYSNTGYRALEKFATSKEKEVEREKAFNFLKDCKNIISFPGISWSFERNILEKTSANLYCYEAIKKVYNSQEEIYTKLSTEFPGRIHYFRENFVQPRTYLQEIDGLWVDIISQLPSEYLLYITNTIDKLTTNKFKIIVNSKVQVFGRSLLYNQRVCKLLELLNVEVQPNTLDKTIIKKVLSGVFSEYGLIIDKHTITPYATRSIKSEYSTKMLSQFLEVHKTL